MRVMSDIYDPQYRAIIARLTSARKAENLTQHELADAIGLTQDKVSRIERCQRQIGLLELLAWAKATKLHNWSRVLGGTGGGDDE